MLTIPPAEQRTESVFVYGTLLHPIVRSVVCLCRTDLESTSLSGYQKVGRNIIPHSASSVAGAVIHVTPAELARLDRYERVPKKYRRERITIDNQAHWVYLLNQPSVVPPASI